MRYILTAILITTATANASICNSIIINPGNLPHKIKKNIEHKFKRELPLLDLSNNKIRDDKAIELVISAIQPFGYINPKVIINSKKLKTCEQISASVAFGPITKISKIESNIASHDQNLLKPGDDFSAKAYKKHIQKLYQIWRSKGYRNVDLSKSKVVIDPKTNSAVLKTIVIPGKKYSIGKIIIASKSFEPDLIKKYVTFKRNAPYSVNAIQNTQESLMNSGYFRNVDLQVIDKESTRVPIKIITKPTEKIRTVTGLGYDNVDSLKAIFNARIIINKAGHIINTISNFSKNNTLVQFGYNIPNKLISSAKYIFQASYIIDRKKNDRSINFSARYSKKTSNLALSYGLNAIHNQQKTLTNKIISNMIYPFFNISRKFILMIKNHEIKNNWSFSTLIAKKNLASNINLVQARSSYYSKVPINDNFRFVFAGQLGVNYTSDPDKQPLPTLLTLGGNNGLRGYALNSIINRQDQLQILRAVSFELQKKMAENLYGTAFVDLGQVSASFNDPWYRGIGVGAVYTTAIGDVNVSIAKPLDLLPGETNRHFRLAISYSM